MSNDKHYPTHPGAEHPPIMTCEIPLEEYESLKRDNAELKAKLESVRQNRKGDSMKCDELKPVHVPAEICGERTVEQICIKKAEEYK